MAKQSLPSFDDEKPERPKTSHHTSSVNGVANTETVITEGYIGRAVDVKMDHLQAVKFKAIARALEDRQAMLKNGSPVNNRRRAVLWMIENYNG